MVCSRFRLRFALLLIPLQAERKSGSTSRPFMTYVQDVILRHLTLDQVPHGLSGEQWDEMKDAARAIAEIGDNRELALRSNVEIDE
jgi:hypothetical protein